MAETDRPVTDAGLGRVLADLDQLVMPSPETVRAIAEELREARATNRELNEAVLTFAKTAFLLRGHVKHMHGYIGRVLEAHPEDPAPKGSIR